MIIKMKMSFNKNYFYYSQWFGVWVNSKEQLKTLTTNLVFSIYLVAIVEAIAASGIQAYSISTV